MNNNEIIKYKTNEYDLGVRIDYERNTVWLTTNQIAEIFQTKKQNISYHLNNILNDNKLDKSSVVKEFLITASDGKKYKTKIYNLEIIKLIGYKIDRIKTDVFNECVINVLDEYKKRR